MFLPAYRFFFNGFCHLPHRFISILHFMKQTMQDCHHLIISGIGHKYPLLILPSSIFPNAVPN